MSELTLTAGSAEQEYEQAPCGEHRAVLVGIIKSENEETKFGPKDVLYFYFELAKEMSDGRPFLVRKKFNHSRNEKSNLYKFLTKWRGQPFKNGESVDLGKLLNTGCILEIEPWTPEGSDKTLHLVDRARNLDKGEWIKPSGGFDRERIATRIEEKKAEFAGQQPEPVAAKPAPKPEKPGRQEWTDEDDVPF